MNYPKCGAPNPDDAEIRGVIQEGTAVEISEILGDNAEDIDRAWANTKKPGK